jgi:lipopolysaccharide/colanic/teichoic acid biosynthesis glycosyltransferase
MLAKRGLDIVLALLGLILLSPIFVGLALALLLEHKGPVFFRQQRPGLHGRPFILIKFRSMTDERDPAGNLLADGARLTRLGRLLRSTSLDELPELWNILRGDMSIVGPRPLLMRYLERYSSEQARRHAVRPGLTGHAQVNGRNALSWDEKLALDTWYVDHRSMMLDLRIIAATVLQVLRRQGISAAGEATMGEFMGRDEDAR